jgi:Cu/Ag efflux protein CusF
MKKLILIVAAVAAISAISVRASAGTDMGSTKIPTKSPEFSIASNGALTDAVVTKVDPATGLVALKHDALKNVGLPAATTAFRTTGQGMFKQMHAGDRIKVRIENVNGAMTIVKMEK